MFFAGDLCCREMSVADRAEACELWDSEPNIIVPIEFGCSKMFQNYLELNAGLSFVVREREGGRIIATLLGSTDGLAGYLRHAYVVQGFRGKKIMHELEGLVLANLREIYGVKYFLAFVMADNCSGRRSFEAHHWKIQEGTTVVSPLHNNDMTTSGFIENKYTVRSVVAGDMAALFDFWNGILDDSKSEFFEYEYLWRFVQRNQGLSALVLDNQSGAIAGSLLAGSDGLYANLRFLAVEEAFMRSGIIQIMSDYVVARCKSQGIGYIFGIAEQNTLGESVLWNNAGWQSQSGVILFQKS